MIFKNRVYLVVVFCLTFSFGFFAQSKTNSSPEIKKLITKKRNFNRKYGYGYRIQIYYGNETKARSLQKKFKVNYPNVYTKLDYEQPYWKIKVGNYKTKLEADKAKLEYSEKFSGLIVIPLGK
ncbi:SPOR domain-containing protein [Polaribacter porphyrae]|uniref:SPOR domain-containing protein n=1 Tax=Polaribacter porphyrae TaxID=1137780 RepID=A0A2S7WRV5_9FLAO|nr:SPOR domain-containing protein [Polaribacter porphyrae]PQJ80333.1 hypothetical protein BTO18_14625 [Polaribacter porphyrae]